MYHNSKGKCMRCACRYAFIEKLVNFRKPSFIASQSTVLVIDSGRRYYGVIGTFNIYSSESSTKGKLS